MGGDAAVFVGLMFRKVESSAIHVYKMDGAQV